MCKADLLHRFLKTHPPVPGFKQCIHPRVGICSGDQPVRLLDYYRTPGFSEIYKLYGYCRKDTLTAEFHNLYNRGLDLLSLQQNPAGAGEFFRRCLKICPGDDPSGYMLRITEISLPGGVKIRGFA